MKSNQRKAMFARLATGRQTAIRGVIKRTQLREADIERARRDLKRAPAKARLALLIDKHPNVARAILAGELALASVVTGATAVVMPISVVGTAPILATAGGATKLGYSVIKSRIKERNDTVKRLVKRGYTPGEARVIADARYTRKVQKYGALRTDLGLAKGRR
jgi:hypothetical protein